MNHLMRELAPVTDHSWSQIDQEATRSLKHVLAGAPPHEFTGPLGWGAVSSTGGGRTENLDGAALGPVEVARRTVAPLIELRSAFSLAKSELAAADRGATDLDLDPVIDAGRASALAEDQLVFHGYQPGGVSGSRAVDAPSGGDHQRGLQPLSRARGPGGGRSPRRRHRRSLHDRPGSSLFHRRHRDHRARGLPGLRAPPSDPLGGPVVWAPAVDGAVVLSQRGGDFELTVGQDFSVGYRSEDATSVNLYIEESLSASTHPTLRCTSLTSEQPGVRNRSRVVSRWPGLLPA